MLVTVWSSVELYKQYGELDLKLACLAATLGKNLSRN